MIVAVSWCHVFVVGVCLIGGNTNAQHVPRPRVVPASGQPQTAPAKPPEGIARPETNHSRLKPEPLLHGQAFIDVLKAQNEGLRRRLDHRWVGGKLKKESMPAGAAGMNLFTKVDHEAKSYVRNPDLWAQDLVGHLTGLVIYNDFCQESYGGVLITPRHLLFCAHAHPHAHQTWGPNPERPSPVHRFLTKDGKLIESTQLHQAKSFGAELLPGLDPVDLCVALLDRDLEAEGLKVVPVFPEVTEAEVTLAMEWAKKENQPFSFIGISQGTTRVTSAEPPEPLGNYPRKHQRMCYIKDHRDLNSIDAKPGAFGPWNYRVWDGDSGSPTFILLRGVPHLWMILTGAPGNGPRAGSYIDHINALIVAADENAIRLARLERPTGLKLRVGRFEAGARK